MSDSKSAAALRRTLQSYRAKDIPPSVKAGTDGEVVELDSTMSTIDAAFDLWRHNILGAPVWDASREKYVGFFDMRDILSAVVSCASALQAEAGEGEEEDGGDADAASGGGSGEDKRGALLSKYNTHMVKELSNLGGGKKGDSDKEGPGGDGGGKDVPTISYLAARNPFHYCGPDATLEELCRALIDRKCHRVPIVNGDNTNKCKGIVSQSALVKFLSDRTVSRDDLQESLAEAGLPYRKDVVSILDTASATEAFRLLDSHRLSGIAVVDEDGRLVGNTSARDIKLAALDEGRTAVDKDILSYLASVRQATPQKKERYPSCHVHEDSTVAHVVNLLAKTGYHRVFVVDEEIKPVGVISVADILKFAIGGGAEGDGGN